MNVPNDVGKDNPLFHGMFYGSPLLESLPYPDLLREGMDVWEQVAVALEMVAMAFPHRA